MSKYQFPVGKITLERYRKERSNTLRKIRRIQRKYGVDLSSEIPTPKLEEIPSRKEFNRWVREVRDFRKRGNLEYQFRKNPYGVVARESDIREAERKVKIVQKNFEEEIAKHQDLPFYQGGKQHGTVGMQPTRMADMNKPPDFDFDSYRQQLSVDKRMESLDRQAEDDYYSGRKEIMRDNFAEVLEENFNNYADELAKNIRDMTPEEFYEMYLMFPEWDFENFYPAISEGVMSKEDEYAFHSDVAGKIEKMEFQFEQFNRGELNDDLMTHPNFK